MSRFINETIGINSSVELTRNSEKIGVACLYMFLSFFGLSLELLVLYIVFKQNGFHLSPFYTFLVTVISTEVVCFLLYAFYAGPCVLFSDQIFGTLLGKVLGNFETVDFLALVSITFVISVNRALSLKGSKLYHKLFTKRWCVVYVWLSWIFAGIMVAVDISLGCETVFFPDKYYFAEVCVGQPPALTATSLTIYVCVYGVAILYVYAFWILYKKQKQVAASNQQINENMEKRKRKLFYQALCIWVTLFINVISFRIIPEFLSGLSAVILTAFIILGTNFISPVCMLLFSTDIRTAAKNILLCRDMKIEKRGTNRTGRFSEAWKATSMHDKETRLQKSVAAIEVVELA